MPLICSIMTKTEYLFINMQLWGAIRGQLFFTREKAAVLSAEARAEGRKALAQAEIFNQEGFG